MFWVTQEFITGTGLIVVNIIIMMCANVMMIGLVLKGRKDLVLWMVSYILHTIGRFFQLFRNINPETNFYDLNIIFSGLAVVTFVIFAFVDYRKVYEVQGLPRIHHLRELSVEYKKQKGPNFQKKSKIQKERKIHKSQIEKKKSARIDTSETSPAKRFGVWSFGLTGFILQWTMSSTLISLTLPFDELFSAIYMEVIVILLIAVAIFFLTLTLRKTKKPSYNFFILALLLGQINLVFTMLVDLNIDWAFEVTLACDLLVNFALFVIPIVLLIEQEIILQRQQMEVAKENLRQAQKMESIGQLTGGIAHDLNNILTGIMGNVEMALMETDLTPVLKEYLDELAKIGTSASFLTKKLLSIGRKSILEPRLFNPKDEIQEFSKLLTRVIGENISLNLNLKEKIGQIYFDPGNFQQILLNLVINARDAMPMGGKITISLNSLYINSEFLKEGEKLKEGDYLELVIEDTGRGIPIAIRKKIFEPFFTTKSADRGTGMGLAVVSSIISEASGLIRLYSEENVGTVFKVYLPMDSQIDTSLAVEHEEELFLDFTGHMVLIEDDVQILSVMRSFLTQLGFTVSTFSSGEDFLEWHFSQSEPRNQEVLQIIITDVILPDVSGIELIQEIEPLRARQKVLFISGYSKYHLALQKSFIQDYPLLQKPFTLQELKEKIATILKT